MTFHKVILDPLDDDGCSDALYSIIICLIWFEMELVFECDDIGKT